MGGRNSYTVIISDRAKYMLSLDMRFLANVSKEAALAKKKEIIKAIRSLEKLPERHPFFDEAYIKPSKYRKMFIEKYYLVLYQIKDNTVYVDYILDYRKDYGWLI